MKILTLIFALSFTLAASEGKVEPTFTPVSASMKAMLETAATVGGDPSCDPCSSCTGIFEAMLCGIGYNGGCYVACPICPGDKVAALKALPVRSLPLMLPDLHQQQ